MKRYVAGFLFTTTDREAINGLPSVALIQKNRGPANMAGKLNAIGGKIEPGESPYAAMVREFREETDETVTDWREFCVLNGPDWVCHFFVKEGRSYDLRTATDEPIGWYNVERLLNGGYPFKFMKNLRWLIPLAMDGDIRSATIIDNT